MQGLILGQIYEDEIGCYDQIVDIDGDCITTLCLDGSKIGCQYFGNFNRKRILVTEEKKRKEILDFYKERENWIEYRKTYLGTELSARTLFMLERAFLAGEQCGNKRRRPL